LAAAPHFRHRGAEFFRGAVWNAKHRCYVEAKATAKVAGSRRMPPCLDVLANAKVTLRPFVWEDAPALARHANNRKIWRYLTDRFPHPYTLADAQAWVDLQAELVGKSCNWAILQDGEAVGCIGIEHKHDVYRHTARLGYWLGETYWGRGLASAAVALVVPQVFATTPVVRLEAEVFASNAASARVLIKNGFDLESRQARSITKDGVLQDALLFVRFAEDDRGPAMP
jgi:RimJ/RimL family protein N-acetyltransferase